MAKTPIRTVIVRPNSELQGHEFVMRTISTRFYLAIRGQKADEDMILRETLDAIVSHSLPCDPADLAPDQVTGLFDAWSDAWKEATLPPANGRTSETRSPSSRSSRTPARPSRSTTP